VALAYLRDPGKGLEGIQKRVQKRGARIEFRIRCGEIRGERETEMRVCWWGAKEKRGDADVFKRHWRM